MSERASSVDDLTRLIPAWLAMSRTTSVSTGLDPQDALVRAAALLDQIDAGQGINIGRVDPEIAETLFALLSGLLRKRPSEKVLGRAETIFELVKAMEWPSNELGGPREILLGLAFVCWRSASWLNQSGRAARWFREHESLVELPSDFSRRIQDAEDLIRDPGGIHDIAGDQLFAACALLRKQIETDPAAILIHAIRLFDALRSANPLRGIDERDYYRGELALIAGLACRILNRRPDARKWFGRAETSFAVTHNAVAHIGRVAYQRLALALEERDFTDLSEQAQSWSDVLLKFGLSHEALKCRFLVAHVLKETEQLDDAKSLFAGIASDARDLKDELLEAIALQNLSQIHAFVNEAEEAIRTAERAARVFDRLHNRVQSAKLQIGMGVLLRSQGRGRAAISALREAQTQFDEIEMPVDRAVVGLMIAEILLDADEEATAEAELRASLEVLDDLKIDAERRAALTLLRDSIRRRQIDRQALRSLNGYFEEPKS